MMATSKTSVIKLWIVLLFFPAAIAAQQGAPGPSDKTADKQADKRTDSDLRWLNVKGAHGAVRFDHKTHETAAPDPTSVHRADPKATCVGCHHTRNSVGAPQLWKCASCHLEEGQSKNPKDRNDDEVDSERAFHSKCVSCHKASNKGPVDCAGCHTRSE
jgi:hypothetical protein